MYQWIRQHGSIASLLIALGIVYGDIGTSPLYVILTLQADNKGEGGIFSLYTLLRKRGKWLIIPAVIGGASLLADGMITPPITVTSAIEGLDLVLPINEASIVTIVLIILTALFMIQRFGTDIIGKVFGPMMFLLFSMLAILGLSQIVNCIEIIASLNPY